MLKFVLHSYYEELKKMSPKRKTVNANVKQNGTACWLPATQRHRVAASHKVGMGMVINGLILIRIFLGSYYIQDLNDCY